MTQGHDGRWYKDCPGCGEPQSYLRRNYAEHSARLGKFCKACSNLFTDNSNRGMYEFIRLSWVTKCATGAETRGLEWSLTPEDIWEVYIAQGGVCALSGLPIGWAEVGPNHTASLDRIDSSRGYTVDNIQLVHKDVNFMKQSYSQEYFLELCKKITKYKEQRNGN